MLLIILVFVIVVAIFVGYVERLRKSKVSSLVNVIVLGDIGHSPRTCGHAASLSDMGLDVILAGYMHSAVPELYERENLRIVSLGDPPHCNLPYMKYLLKILSDSFQLIRFFTHEDVASVVLVQNPPSIPLLTIAVIWCFLVNAKLVIDWHNYGHSLLAMKHGESSIIAFVCRAVELLSGDMACVNFCVSRAMQKDLNEYGIDSLVFYDRPSGIYHPRNVTDEQKLKLLDEVIHKCSKSECIDFSGLFDNLTSCKNCPFIIISSTSWTEDENFSALFDALSEYDRKAPMTNLPSIICIITGKGPCKQLWYDAIVTKRFQYISFFLPWLSLSDYALTLSLCDIGICVHTSSSKLDLPMKVLDMLGSGLPVCCYDYGPCLNELITHESTGLLYKNAQTLSRYLQSLAESKVKDTSFYCHLRQSVSNLELNSWAEEWRQVVAPVFEYLLEMNR